jgi:peptidoglycan/xylan/chitin deacetylase (PgdA/CDA1 family)
VDLDPLYCYQSIHGLTPPVALPPDGPPDPIYSHALPRLLDLFKAEGVRATFFVITQDLSHPAHRDALRRALAEGHELGSHTHHHPYNLPSLPEDAMRLEVADAHAALTALIGAPPVGFRAPGYNIDARTLALLEALGYRYDTSVFPCPPYYTAKASVMGLLRLLGRPSGSALVDWRTQFAPLTPYRPDRAAAWRAAPSAAEASRLVELPVCVLPGARLPLIGTSLIMLGPRLSAGAMRLAARTHALGLSLELHGIDAIDPDADPIPNPLRRRQPDLRYTWAHKARTFRAALGALRGHYAFGTCDALARSLSATTT